VHRATPYRLIRLCIVISLLVGCERRQHLVEQHLLEFGTIIDITMISSDLLKADRLLGEIEQRLRQQRGQWHAWEDSDLSRFNQQLQQNSSAEIPPSLVKLLELSRQYHDATDGLFNPAMGKLIGAYGFHGGAVDAELVASLRLDIPDMQDLSIVGNQASTTNPQLQIDLGGIAKGYAIGLIGEFLDANGIKHYVINAGGDMLLAGNRFGRPWRIGIQNPFAPGVIASVELQGKHSLFTSGNYERSYRLGDKLQHHIIDPRSGEPSRGQSSATVLDSDPVRADVAATALMIDGLQRHRELSKSLGIKDFLVISESREIQISQSLAQKIDILTHWPVIIID
jgi:thiamine biosynthesis lipoprotein